MQRLAILPYKSALLLLFAIFTYNSALLSEAKRASCSRSEIRALKHFLKVHVPPLFFLKSETMFEVHIYCFREG